MSNRVRVMKIMAGAVATLLVLLTVVTGQQTAELYTQPSLLSREALERLNLKQAWRAFVPTEGRRDGFFSVRVLDDQILVQMRNGSVHALDARTGATQWRVHIGVPYRVSQLLGYNARSVFAVRGPRLFALDRKNGGVQWEFELPGGPSAAPVADEERVYICVATDRLEVYDLPRKVPADIAQGGGAAKPAESADQPAARQSYTGVGVSGKASAAVGPLSSARMAEQGTVSGPQPEFVYEYIAETRLELAPLMAENLLALAGSDGTFFAISKFEPRLQYRFRAQSPASSRLGQYENIAYVAAQDYNVYALDILAGKITWRFTGSSPLLRKPEVTDDNVYIVSFVDGLHRINRLTGDLVWNNRYAARFLSENKKFVYAMDRTGRLLILDRARGTPVGTYDTRDFPFPVSNETTDRFFLAANDGTLLCLYDRDYPRPLRTKKVTEPKAETVKPEAKQPGGKAEKPPEKPKDKGEAMENKPEK
jgi:outer membrane protein assembly factor BamB